MSTRYRFAVSAFFVCAVMLTSQFTPQATAAKDDDKEAKEAKKPEMHERHLELVRKRYKNITKAHDDIVAMYKKIAEYKAIPDERKRRKAERKIGQLEGKIERLKRKLDRAVQKLRDPMKADLVDLEKEAKELEVNIAHARSKGRENKMTKYLQREATLDGQIKSMKRNLDGLTILSWFDAEHEEE